MSLFRESFHGFYHMGLDPFVWYVWIWAWAYLTVGFGFGLIYLFEIFIFRPKFS